MEDTTTTRGFVDNSEENVQNKHHYQEQIDEHYGDFCDRCKVIKLASEFVNSEEFTSQLMAFELTRKQNRFSCELDILGCKIDKIV